MISENQHTPIRAEGSEAKPLPVEFLSGALEASNAYAQSCGTAPKAATQRRLVRRLKDALHVIDDHTDTGFFPSAVGRRPPTIEQLVELTEAVLLLATTERRKKRLGFSSAVELVHKRWRGIHLPQFLHRLAARTDSMIPNKPSRSPEVEYLFQIEQFAEGDGVMAKKAEAFLAHHQKLRNRNLKLADIDWLAHEDILRMPGETLLIVRREHALVRYLELDREWLLAKPREKEYRAALRALMPLQIWEEEWERLDSEAEGASSVRRKALAKHRQQRRRTKIAYQKSVMRLNRRIRALGPRFVGLRDVRLPHVSVKSTGRNCSLCSVL